MTLPRLIARLLGRSPAGAADTPASPVDASDGALADWARELGVSSEVMGRLVQERRALVYDVAADPRRWGFDLVGDEPKRRDVATEFRSRTRLQGTLAESFLAGHRPLLSLVPDPPTMPDGTPLDEQLARAGGLEPEAARAVAQHLRATIQATLGRPLDQQALEHALREASWEHEFDPAHVRTDVLRALRTVLRP